MNYQRLNYIQAVLSYIIRSAKLYQSLVAISDGLGKGLKMGESGLDISSDCFIKLNSVPCCKTVNDLNFVGNFTTIFQMVPIKSDFMPMLLTIPVEISEFSFCKYFRTSSEPWPS